jgi:hypothetical protein
MKPIAYLTAALVLALGVAGAGAQGATESFMGIVKAVSGSSVTVERGTITGVFTVDTKTHVAARGATAKTKEAKAAGKAGLTVPDAVHVGDQVVVRYHEMKGTMMASEIQVRTPSAAAKK